jgi:hypothetical protein
VYFLTVCKQEVYSELGVQVNWDGFQAVEIQVTKSYQNQTCGLCGDYNQNPEDDWRLGPECDVSGEIVRIRKGKPQYLSLQQHG